MTATRRTGPDQARVIVAATEREKESLAKQLHDGLLQTLSAASILARVASKRATALPSAQNPELKRLQETIDSAIDEARFLIRQLQPPDEERNALIAALQDLARSVGTKCRCDCEFQPAEDRPHESLPALALFRIAQQAVAAALHRDRVSRITIALSNHVDLVKLEIRDNGRSCGRPGPVDQEIQHLMKSHAKAAGGELRIEAGKQGTIVTCTYPAGR